MELERLKILSKLVKFFNYVVIETEKTTSHIELLSATCSDRGRYKWIVESKAPRELTIDSFDMFPRLYFEESSLVAEIEAWLIKREQFDISSIYMPLYENGKLVKKLFASENGEVEELVKGMFRQETTKQVGDYES
jgi:hypothetical protein